MKAAAALNRIAIAAGATSTVIGAIAVVDAATGRSLIPAIPAGATQPAPWVSASILVIGVCLLALARSPDSRSVRRVVIGSAALILAASLVSLATRLAPGLAATFRALQVRRPLGGLTLLLASMSLLATGIGRLRRVAGALGLAVTAIGFVICLGLVYGGPLLTGLELAPFSLTFAVASLVVGVGLITVGGQQAWPNRLFIGASVQTVLFRWLVPLVALAVIVTEIATVTLFSGVSRALGSALNTMLSVAVTLVVISYLSRIIGTRLEHMTAELGQANVERGRAERISRGLEQRAHEVAGIGTYVIKLNARTIRLSPEMAHLLRAGADEIEMPLEEYRRRFYYDEAERQQSVTQAEAAYVGGGQLHLEARVVRGDGEVIWVRSSSSSEHDVHGEPIMIGVLQDVTESRRAFLKLVEQADQLGESEQRFTRVFKSVPAGLAISRVDDGRFIEVNDAFERIFGYSRDETIGRLSTDLGLWIDPAERQRFVRRVSLGGGEATGEELHLRAKDGRALVVLASALVVDFQGIEALLTSFIDVTAQRKAEEALRLSEEKFGTIFRESPVALTVSEFSTGRLVEVNAAYVAHVGASSASELLGKTVLELGVLTVEDRQRYIVAPIAAGRSNGLLVPVRNLRGEPRMSELSLSTYEVDGQRFILTSTIDVTDRLRAEDQARQELAERRRVQRRLDLALRAGGILTFELDPVTRRIQADLGISDLYGITRDDDSTVSWDAWAARVHPDDFPLVTEQIKRIEGGSPEAFVDFRVVRPDGSLRYVHGAAALLPANGDHRARIVGVNIDVTSHKLTELELRKHQESLETLVESRTAELRAAKEAAESASRAKDAFLAHMSHEIRTPMNAILGYAQLLQADAALEEDQRRKVTAIHTSGDHLLGLLNDILEMSRLQAGRMTFSIQPFDLHALLDGVRPMFTELTSQRGLQFSLQLAPGLVRGIESDPGKVRQVLVNLLGNATKFTDRGGIAVRVSSRAIGPEQCQVTMEVEDTGPGIPPDDQEVIFSAFGQAAPGRDRAGTGLGLTISRSMARLLGGDLTVRSTVGQGSTFTFTFTATRVPDAALGETERARGRQRLDPTETRRKALVVDDVPSNRELAQESLSRAGFQARGAATGEEGIELSRSWSPDLLLIDLHMPGMGGLAAVKVLREADSEAVIVVTTAGTDDATQAAVSAAGAAGFLRKPYRESELFDTIARAMGVSFVEVEGAAAAPADTERPDLAVLVRQIPADLIAELREACRQARALRLVQLADRVAEHSAPAAEAIRELANGFRYRALLEALEGTNGTS
jgi:PAS domain S-box-containing protein